MSPLSDAELKRMAATAGVPAMTIDDHRPCRECGYDLIGLQVDGVCPECGTSIQSISSGASTSSTPHARSKHERLLEYPKSRLKVLRNGLTMMAIAVPLLTMLPLVVRVMDSTGYALTEEPVIAGVYVATSVLWVLGVVMLSVMPMHADHIPAKLRPWYAKVGMASIVTQCFWIGAALSWLVFTAQNTTPALGVAIGLRVVAVFGLIPTCWQLSLIARAANDDHLAERLWAIGWGMPAALVGLVVLGFFPTTFLIMCGGLFIFYGLTFGVFVMQLLLAKHVFDVRADVAWAIRNQNHTRYREEEFRERAAKRAAEALVSDALTLDDVPAAARAAEYESHSRFAHGEHQADIKPAGSSSTSHTPMVNPKQEQQTTQRPPPKPLKGEHRIEQSDDGETYDIID